MPVLSQNFARLLAGGRLVAGSRQQWTIFDPATLRNAPVMVAIGMWLGGGAGDIMLGAGALMSVGAVMGVVWPALLREEHRQRAREGVAT